MSMLTPLKNFSADAYALKAVQHAPNEAIESIATGSRSKG